MEYTVELLKSNEAYIGSNDVIQRSLSRVFVLIVLDICFYVKAHINSYCEVC